MEHLLWLEQEAEGPAVVIDNTTFISPLNWCSDWNMERDLTFNNAV
jgi:hypothetical protein